MNLLFAMLIDLAMAILLGVLSRALMEIIRQNIPLRVHPRQVRLFVGLLFWACFFLSACIFFIVRRNFLIQDGNAEIILRMKALVYAYYRSRNSERMRNMELQQLQATLRDLQELRILAQNVLNTLQNRDEELDELVDGMGIRDAL
ncbi:MAG: hypothetical protein LQ337_003879 [Flavoplaca oasis]|nr:MAG: hypothetical protein LQ337_003879 [Flavoplaca oasis]